MATAQDLIRGLCNKTYYTQNPGRHFCKPPTLQIGQWVLARRDLITTNTRSAINKILRTYTGPHKIVEISGNHFKLEGLQHMADFYRSRLKPVTFEKEDDQEA